MSILINEKVRVLVQGITGRSGRVHTKFMKDYGTNVVAGVTPGKGGEAVCNVPVYDTVSEALEMHEIDASLVLVPPRFILETAHEAISNGIALIVLISEHVPVQDMIRIKSMALRRGVRLIGPNTIGIISPGKAKVGIMPDFLYSPGEVGVISRSGTLTHEIASNLTFHGIGQSTCVGIGGDAIVGTNFIEGLELFRKDADTEVIILVGEIGGTAEEAAADFVKRTKFPKPIIAFIAGRTCPPEKKMGHAGAIIEKGSGTAQAKAEKLKEANIPIAQNMIELLTMVKRALG